MVFNDACGFIYKIRKPSMKLNEEQESYIMNFFIDKNEYILTVPVSDVKFDDKILALTPYNKTNFIKKILGPSGNMFGMKLTPKNIGLEKLIIWKNKVQYKFKEKDIIDLSSNSTAISYDTSESDVGSDEPKVVNEIELGQDVVDKSKNYYKNYNPTPYPSSDSDYDNE